MQERFLKILNALMAHDENKYCFDCHQRGPVYVNVTIGSFVCTHCGGALRKYNHRVKSITMSNFTPAEIDFLRKRGNKACRKIYLALSDDQSLDEKNFQNGARDDYLRSKYQVQKWYRQPSAELEAETMRENQEIIDRAEQNGTQRTTCTNTATGLIVLPSRPTGGSTSSVNNVDEKSATSKQGHANSKTPNADSSGFSTGFDPFGAQQKDPFEPRAHLPTVPVSNPNDPFTTSAPSKTQFTSVEDPFAAFTIPTSTSQHTMLFNNPSQISHPGNWANLSSIPSNTQPNVNLPTTSTSDKYAALAELDGMLKSASVTSSSVMSTGLSSIPVPAQSSMGSHSAGLWSESLTPNNSSVFNSQRPMAPVVAPTVPPSSHNPFASSIAAGTNASRHYSASNPFITAQIGQGSITGTTPSLQPMTNTSTMPINRNPTVFQPTFSSASNPFYSTSTVPVTNLSASGPAPWPAHLNSNPVGSVTLPLHMSYPMNGFQSSTSVGLSSKNMPPVSPPSFDSLPFY